jgi:hypothetical protein
MPSVEKVTTTPGETNCCSTGLQKDSGAPVKRDVGYTAPPASFIIK